MAKDTLQISLRVPAELAERLDEYASEAGVKRHPLILEIIEQYLDETEFTPAQAKRVARIASTAVREAVLAEMNA